MPRDNKVVVTGMGAVSAYGVGRDCLWEGLRGGTSGIDWISLFDTAPYRVQYAGEVQDFDPAKFLKKHYAARRDRSTQMALVSAAEALTQAGLLNDQQDALAAFPIGIIVGSGLGPCFEVEFAYNCYHQGGLQAVRPTTVPKSMFNVLSSHLSLYFGLRGVNHVIASACASSNCAIGHAYLLIKHGIETAVLCGGADSPLCPSIFSFWSQMNVLARRTVPYQACRPFDRQRNGLVLAEGAAMIVLESLESARQRGADILAQVIGYGAASDAYHITTPSEEGQVLAMCRCLADAGIEPHQVNYINAHGTGTKSNDMVEAQAIRKVFGARGAAMPISSTKSMLGHAMGASGALEFVACVQAMQHGFVPATLNCDTPDPDIGLDYVAHRGRAHRVETVMSNSFAFGGNNAVVLLRRFV